MNHLTRLQFIFGRIGAFFFIMCAGLLAQAQNPSPQVLHLVGMETNTPSKDHSFSNAVELFSRAGYAPRHIAPRDSFFGKSNETFIVIYAGSLQQGEINASQLQGLKSFVDNGGNLLLLMSQDVDKNPRSLAGTFGVMVGRKQSAEKIQSLKLAPFQGLQWHCPDTVLLDTEEEAFAERKIVGNDTAQPTVENQKPDLAGVRLMLARQGKGKIAIIAGGECFQDRFLGHEVPGKNHNRELLLRLIEWFKKV